MLACILSQYMYGHYYHYLSPGLYPIKYKRQFNAISTAMPPHRELETYSFDDVISNSGDMLACVHYYCKYIYAMPSARAHAAECQEV